MMNFHYRLAGDLDGRDFAFDLENGDFRVGSSSQSDLHLPIEGVSREHALLRVLPGGVSVEDSGSRNGTWVDGHRVQKAAVPDEAVIGFGPARLTLSRAEAGEAMAGLLFHITERADTPLASGLETPLLPNGGGEITAALLEHLEMLLLRLEGPAGLSGALAEIVSFVDATGGWLLRWIEDGPPAVLAAAGRPPTLPHREALGSFGPEAEGRAGPIFQRHGDDPPLDLLLQVDSDGLHGLAIAESARGDLPLAYWSVSFRLLLRQAMGPDLTQPSRESRPSRRPKAAALGAPRRLVFSSDFLPGRSPAMAALFAEMELALSTELSLLFLGETGVGKDQLVEIFHRSSGRGQGPLVALNCAAIAGELFEAELFGIARGAATGVGARPGALRRAHLGTIFLDEIGEMPLEHQVKLLRALQEKEVQSVGSNAPTPVDARVLAATNQDLETRVTEGLFRADLFYRLGGHILRVPPLRERRADLPELIDFLIRRALDREPAPILGLSAPALAHLMDYPWPGNVRELKTEISRLVGVCARLGGRRLIDSSLLPERLVAGQDKAGQEKAGDLSGSEEPRIADLLEGAPEISSLPDLDLTKHVESLERALIQEALRRTDGRKAEAAGLLGVHRNGLRKKLKRLGLDGRA